MAKISISALKAKFMTLMKPSQQDFYDIFDSFLHIDNAVALNNTTIDARISVYDEAIRAETPGAIDTLGDVLKVLEGFPESGNVKDMIDAAGGSPGWSSVTGKPNSVAVKWTEQTITNTWTPTWNGVVESFPTRYLVSSQLSGAEKWFVKDIVIQSFPVLIYGTSQPWHANRISAVIIAKNPYVDLTS